MRNVELKGEIFNKKRAEIDDSLPLYRLVVIVQGGSPRPLREEHLLAREVEHRKV